MIFHITDLGRRSFPEFDRFSVNDLDEYIKVSLAFCIAEQDFDLVAELLICRLCLGVRRDAVNLAAMDALLRAQHPSGFLPVAAWPACLEDVPAEEVERATFDLVYHPTIVGLILAACDADAARQAGASR